MEPVGASDDEPDLGVEALNSSVADPSLNGGDDDPSPFAHGLGGLDERGQARPGRPGGPPVEQLNGLGGFEVAGEDSPELPFISYARQMPPGSGVSFPAGRLRGR